MTSDEKRKCIPTGTGLCGRADCGRDIGRHDGGHPHDLKLAHDKWGQPMAYVPCCEFGPDAKCHDVGRVLLCPIHQTNEVSDDGMPSDNPGLADRDIAVPGADLVDRAQVTNDDAEAEAQARKGSDYFAQANCDHWYLAELQKAYRDLRKDSNYGKLRQYLTRIHGRLAMLAGSEQAAVPDAEGRRAHEPNPAPPVAAGQPDDEAEASKGVTVLDDPLPEDADPAAIRKHEDVFRRAELYCRINTLEADLAEAEERADRHRIDAEEADAAAGKMGRELAKAEARIAELEQELARGRATMNVTFGEDRILALVRNAGQRWHRDLNDSGLLEEVLREQCALYGWGYIGPPRDPAKDRTSLYCEFGRDVARAYVDRALSDTREALK